MRVVLVSGQSVSADEDSMYDFALVVVVASGRKATLRGPKFYGDFRDRAIAGEMVLSKNTPLMTELGPAFVVMLMVTCPEIVHTRYVPFWKVWMLSLFKTIPG